MMSHDIEKLARDVVDSWDMETIIEYAISRLTEYYTLHPDEAEAEAEFFSQ